MKPTKITTNEATPPMRQFAQVVDQIAEAKVLIQRSSLSDLRMALLLLDNAVELIAVRAVNSILTYNRYHREMLSRYAPDQIKADDFLSEMQPKLIDKAREKQVRRLFDEKFKLLEEQGQIGSPVRRALTAIHAYRNEAYHDNRVRRETIRPIVRLSFELACDLLAELRPGSYSIGSEDDWSYFEDRYGLRAHDAPSEAGSRRISESLREGLSFKLDELAESLADHLETRFDEFLDLLDYVSSERIAGRAERFAAAKAWISSYSDRYLEGDARFRRAAADFTFDALEQLRRDVEAMRKVSDKRALVAAFADIESCFEPIEQCLFDMVADYDEYINNEVKAAREREIFSRN